MALTTYSDLVEEIESWTKESSSPHFGSRIPSFIKMAEAVFDRRIRSRYNEYTVTTNTVVGDDTVSVPNDFVELRSARIIGDTTRPLTYVTPYRAAELFDRFDAANTMPIYYTITSNQFRLIPVPREQYLIEIIYFKRIPNLTSTNPTNWLLDFYPDAYVYNVLAAAEGYLRNDERVPIWKAYADQIIAEINEANMDATYNRAPLNIQPDFGNIV